MQGGNSVSWGVFADLDIVFLDIEKYFFQLQKRVQPYSKRIISHVLFSLQSNLNFPENDSYFKLISDKQQSRTSFHF